MHTIEWRLYPDGTLKPTIKCRASSSPPSREEKKCLAVEWFQAVDALDCYQPADTTPITIHDGEISVHWDTSLDSWTWRYTNPQPTNPEWATQFVERMTREGIVFIVDDQINKIREEIEELSEALTAWRRVRPENLTPEREDFAHEMADIILATYVLADITDIALDDAIETKKQIIATRPLRKEHRTPGDQK